MTSFTHAIGSVLKHLFPRQMYERRVFRTKQAEIEEDILPLLIDPQREAMDVGANRGRYMVALSKLTPHVYAFEPDKAHCDRLSQVARRNVSVSGDALSNVEGEASFYVEIDDQGRAAVTNASLVAKNGDRTAEVRTVKTATLDRFADRDIGFVKIDVEGHEIEVLQGGRVFLARQKPVLLVEIEERHRAGALEDAVRLLGELGYVGFFIADRRTHDIADFHAGLQNENELRYPLPRREMKYVNNFIFVPASHDVAKLRRGIDAHFEAAVPRH